MKRSIQNLSLRCKFKDSKHVEVTVVDHSQNVTYQIYWAYAQDSVSTSASPAGEDDE